MKHDDLRISYLHSLIQNDRVPHLLLFTGAQAETEKAAFSFAKEWLQRISNTTELQHYTDIHHAKVEGKLGMHSAQAVRELLEKASLAPFQAAGKVFILEACERMLPVSSNALLKTIEEPDARTIFILLSQEPEKVLATIRSRAQVVRFGKRKAIAPGPHFEKLTQLISDPKLTKVLDFCEEEHKAFEEKLKEIEAEVRDLSKEAIKEMNAQQKQKQELEIEGAIITRWQQEVQTLFMDIAMVFRQVFANDANFLDKVQKALVQAKLAIERQTPLKNALESFFLSFFISSTV